MNITPRTEFHSTHKQWNLDHNLSVEDIQCALGDNITNYSTDHSKVKHEWEFYADGKPCGIWDYKGSRWSAYGPREVFDALGLTIVGE